MELSILIPCYNERDTIREIVSRVLAEDVEGLDKEILISDDGSTPLIRREADVVPPFGMSLLVLARRRPIVPGAAPSGQT
jgi:hypothetical protein